MESLWPLRAGRGQGAKGFECHEFSVTSLVACIASGAGTDAATAALGTSQNIGDILKPDDLLGDGSVVILRPGKDGRVTIASQNEYGRPGREIGYGSK